MIENLLVLRKKLIRGLVIMGVLAAIGGVAYVIYAFQSTSMSLKVDEKIDNTPISVERMRQIGEWEFLCVSDEEMVDTMRKRLFKDDQLIRIYTGKLRIGMNMKEMADDAIVRQGDTLVITLPEVKLLDEKFIDEAATQSFYESGSWDGEDYELLYKKAQRQMKARCLTKDNMQKARTNGKAQVKKMLAAVGIENVVLN